MKDQNIISQWFNEALLHNNQCFNSIITYYHPQLLLYALKICRYNNIAEDALQEAYINAYIHFSEVKHPDKLFNWLLTIVKRACWLQLNQIQRNLPLSVKLIDSQITDDVIINSTEKKNMQEFVHERINQLSDNLRMVVMLRYFSEYNDYKTIANILGIPIGTVRSRLNEAKFQLKKLWHTNLKDLPENLQRESKYWDEFYLYIFLNIYKDTIVQNEFINHLLPDITIIYTSGAEAIGREPMIKEIEDDIKYGSFYSVNSIFNLKDIGIIQGENLNSSEYPERCPPASTFIFYRKRNKVYSLRVHNSIK